MPSPFSFEGAKTYFLRHMHYVYAFLKLQAISFSKCGPIELTKTSLKAGSNPPSGRLSNQNVILQISNSVILNLFVFVLFVCCFYISL